MPNEWMNKGMHISKPGSFKKLMLEVIISPSFRAQIHAIWLHKSLLLNQKMGSTYIFIFKEKL